MSAPASGGGTPIKTAVLLRHSHPGGTHDAAEAAAAAAERVGCKLVSSSDELAEHSDLSGRIEAVSELPSKPDLCLVLGGDGTILKGLRTFGSVGVPVFGINFGTIGFLAAVEREELDQGLELAFSGKFEVMDLPGLQLGPTEASVGLNDVSFTRQPHRRVAELAYRVNGEEIGHVRCDGLVAATPAGSTGYNLANQGPVLAWGVEGYAVSFIAPHTLTARPLVVAPADVLQVRNAGERDAVDIGLDGQPAGELVPGDEVEVRFRPAAGRLAQLSGASFYRRMREKFGVMAALA